MRASDANDEADAERVYTAEPTSCSHVQTFRLNNRVDSRPTQLDYMFVSKSLVPRLQDCRVIQDASAWALSDHCPIAIELDLSL